MVSVIAEYDVTADDKKRINLCDAKTKYFHVKALSNGCYLLKPRVLISPDAISRKTHKMLNVSFENFKNGIVSDPVDLTHS